MDLKDKSHKTQVMLRVFMAVWLQTKNIKCYIKPLKKLAQLSPNQHEYKILLGQVNKQIDMGER